MCIDLMITLGWCLLAFALAATALHVASAGIVLGRIARCRRSAISRDLPQVSIIRPMRGLTDIERDTLSSSFGVRHAKEHVFCCERPSDPSIRFVEGLIGRHPAIRARVLVGDNLATPNPKLNNIAKGWRAAQCDWVVIADSNLMMPSDCVRRLMAAHRPDTGLVCAPPIGDRPKGFWAEVECAFLNTYQARWQYAADSCGFGFAQGKVMLWHRDVLDRAGGISALASELAEDAAATKLVRSAGLKVRLAEPSFVQPIGARTVRQMLSRQIRWAQLRRFSFPHFFAPEILTGCPIPILAGTLAMACLGLPAIELGAAMLVLWLGAEFALARAAGWHFGWMTPAAMIARDLLIPLVWLKGIAAGGYEWQGTRVEVRRAGAGETRTVGV